MRCEIELVCEGAPTMETETVTSNDGETAAQACADCADWLRMERLERLFPDG